MYIFIIILSTGPLMRGILFFIISMFSKGNRLSFISISNSDDKEIYKKENRMASKAYIFIGTIFLLFTIVLSITYTEVLSIFYIIPIILLDILIYALCIVKIGIERYDREKGES